MQSSKEGALLNRGGSESLHRLFLEAFGTQGNPIWKNEHHPCEGFDSPCFQEFLRITGRKGYAEGVCRVSGEYATRVTKGL